MNHELSMSANQLVAASSKKPASEIYESRHYFLYQGERYPHGELHVSRSRRATENIEFCH